MPAGKKGMWDSMWSSVTNNYMWSEKYPTRTASQQGAVEEANAKWRTGTAAISIPQAGSVAGDSASHSASRVSFPPPADLASAVASPSSVYASAVGGASPPPSAGGGDDRTDRAVDEYDDTGSGSSDERAHLAIDALKDPEGGEEEYPPCETNTKCRTWANLVKGYVGAGSFALPFAFYQMGLWLATLTVFAAVVFGALGMMFLLETKYAIPASRPRHTLADMTESAGFGRAGRVVTTVLVLLSQVGTCAAYLKFCGDALHSLIPHWGGVAIPGYAWTLLVLPCATAVTFIQSMRVWAIVSMFGLVALAAGMLLTMVFGWQNYHASLAPVDRYVQADLDHYFYGFGTVAFLFCTVFQLPMERTVRGTSKARGSGYMSVLWSVKVFVALVNIPFGALAYVLFSADPDSAGVPCSNVLLNMRVASDDTVGRWMITPVKIALSVDLFCTYPLQFETAVEMLEKSLGIGAFQAPDAKGWTTRCWAPLLTRTFLSFLAAGFSMIKQFGLLTDLLGGLTMGVSTFVLGPLCWMQAQRLGHLNFAEPASACKWATALFSVLLFFPLCLATLGYSVNALFNPLPEPDFC